MRRHQVAVGLLPVLVALSASACRQKDKTELVVTVWSDLVVPTELDALRIRVDGREQTVDRPFQLTATGEAGKSRIPVQLALVPAGAKDLSITVTAVGSYQGTDIVSQKATLPFMPSQARELVLYLARSCKNISCQDHPGYTCEHGACTRSVAVNTAMLPVYTPKQVAPPPDAGPASPRLDAAALPDVVPASEVSLDTSPWETGVQASAVLNVDKPLLSLGTLDPGKSGAGTVILTNHGKTASGMIAISTTAGLTATGCSGMLAAGASCTITVTATPTTVGAFDGTVTIVASPGTAAPLEVAVLATVAAAGAFTFSPVRIDLGNVTVGVPVPQQTITVTAIVTLADLTYSTSGPEATVDQAASTCTAALAAGTSCTIVVDFIATSSGQRQDSVVIAAGGAAAQPRTVPITANARAPAKLAINPTEAQFATGRGQTSSPATFAVFNLGESATGPIVVEITGADRASFTQYNNCLALASLDTCTVTVLYKPTLAAASAETATLTVTDSAGAATASATLNGTAMGGPDLFIVPVAGGDLGSVLVGTTGASTVFTVMNPGNIASGTITVSLVSPDFTITDDTCTGTSLATTGTCILAIALKPQTPGAKFATFSVTGTNTAPAVKTLTGTGISPPSLSVDPSYLDFHNVRVNQLGAEQTVTISNIGGAVTGALVIDRAGDYDVFPITSNGCSAPLAPLVGTCTFTLGFTPKTAKGYAATFTVTDGTTSAAVVVSGTGLGPTNIIITPGEVSSCTSSSPPCYPDTDVSGTSGPITFTVEASSSFPAGVIDTGAITVTLTGAGASQFAIAANGCATPLLAGATCTVSVNFAPTSVGGKQATLSVTTANGGEASATLSANGT